MFAVQKPISPELRRYLERDLVQLTEIGQRCRAKARPPSTQRLPTKYELKNDPNSPFYRQRKTYLSLYKLAGIVDDIDAAGLRLIARFEGYRSQIYRDLAGHPTIGYGHLLLPGEHARFAKGITRQAAWALLKQDAAKAVNAVRQLVIVPLSQNQFNALVSLVFNIGECAFASSTLLKKLNAGQYHEVGRELLRWVKVTVHDGQGRPVKKPVRGLLYRRSIESTLFYTK